MYRKRTWKVIFFECRQDIITTEMMLFTWTTCLRVGTGILAVTLELVRMVSYFSRRMRETFHNREISEIINRPQLLSDRTAKLWKSWRLKKWHEMTFLFAPSEPAVQYFVLPTSTCLQSLCLTRLSGWWSLLQPWMYSASAVYIQSSSNLM